MYNSMIVPVFGTGKLTTITISVILYFIKQNLGFYITHPWAEGVYPVNTSNIFSFKYPR